VLATLAVIGALIAATQIRPQPRSGEAAPARDEATASIEEAA